MRHRPQPLVAAEEMRRGMRGVADEAHGADLPLGARRADRGGIGHHLGHLLAGAMARIHRQEGRLGHVGTHRPGVVGGHAGWPQLLQEDRLEVDEMEERTGDVHHRLAGADPLALGIAQVEIDRRVARAAELLQPLQRQPRREYHRPAHEDRVGDAAVAEAADHLLGAVEVVIGIALDLAVTRMHAGPLPLARSAAVRRQDGPARSTGARP